MKKSVKVSKSKSIKSRPRLGRKSQSSNKSNRKYWAIFGLAVAVVLIIAVLFLLNNNAGVSGNVITGMAGADFAKSFTGLIKSIIGAVQDSGKPLFSALFGTSLEETGADLFIRVLVFLLVVLVIFAITDLMPPFQQRPWIQTGIGVIISIIGIRFLPIDLIRQLAFPSSALVATIFIGLPFLIFGWLLIKLSVGPYFRRAGWTIFGVIIFVLWVYNFDSTKPWSVWVYPLFLLACILAFAFDATLQEFWHKARAGRTIEKYSGVERNRVIARIKDLQTALGTATNVSEQMELTKQIANLRKNLAKLP